MSEELSFNLEEVTEFSSKSFIDNMLKEAYVSNLTSHPLLGQLRIGDHLVTSRSGYTHHGIFVGYETTSDSRARPCIIHYSGLADGLNSGPVEKVTLEGFCSGKGFTVKPYVDRVYSREESVDRAHNRLCESNYNLVWNNCEHFVEWCINGVALSRQVNGVAKVTIKNIAKHLGKINPVSNIATIVAENSRCLVAYINGDISKEKLFTELSHSAITSTSMLWYGGLAQAAIPIPAVGFLIGSAIGFFIGNSLYQSGHIALGETAAVKEAKERRQEIEDICAKLIPEIRKKRQQMEQYLEQHFSQRARILTQAFSDVDSSILSCDTQAFIVALEKINDQFNETLQYRTFEEFDEVMRSDEAFRF
ncbi:lecithin retinol acyltransferase family protein [Thalassolituus oleivorans]|uniref:lecithin retinol acyltransferase family protein n=1 Tax=Thalassolituus oleivorans TaxID=187493 RepID=UPI0023F01E97|nr:lecithin retinol acyltransferase family protein [Thalassolituus oleivorans]